MKVLHLTLKKKWFDMILSGEKKEEYREVKPYWIKRLVWEEGTREDYDIVHFYQGWAYDTRLPNFTIECKGIFLCKGLAEWGAALGKEYFTIKLGNILSTKNIHQ